MTSTALRQPGSPVSAALDGSAVPLYSLSVARVWAACRRQPVSFWLVTVYMVFEYVRPQAIYRSLAVVPWAQLLLLAAPAAFLLEGARFKARNPINIWMVVFSGAVALSWMFAVNPSASQAQILVFVNWIMVYILVANTVTSEVRFFIFFGFFLLASLKMSQHGARTWAVRGFSFANWGATGAPGWFHNSGEFGIQMCIFFPLALYYIGALRKYWEKWKRILMFALPVTAIMSLIATNSRGALVGGAAVGLWMLARSRHRVRAFVALGVATVVVILAMPEEQKERFGTMGSDNTSESRFMYWRHGVEIFKAYPVTGIGYENWGSYYEANYGIIALPHNIFVQAGAELGAVGLIGLIGLIGSSFVVNRRTRKAAAQLGERGHFMEMTARGLDGAMIGFLASASFVTVLYYPYLWFALGLTSALHAAAISALGGGPAPDARSEPSPVALSSGWRTAASLRPARVIDPSRAMRPGSR